MSVSVKLFREEHIGKTVIINGPMDVYSCCDPRKIRGYSMKNGAVITMVEQECIVLSEYKAECPEVSEEYGFKITLCKKKNDDRLSIRYPTS